MNRSNLVAKNSLVLPRFTRGPEWGERKLGKEK